MHAPTYIARQDIVDASKRVGLTAIARGRWLLRVCQTDMHTVKGKEWFSLKAEWLVFAEWPILWQASGHADAHSTPNQMDIRLWHESLKRKIERLIKGAVWSEKVDAVKRFQLHEGRLSAETRTMPIHERDRVEALALVAMKTLESVKDRFRVCGECGKAFIRTDRMLYCSKTCGGNRSKREWRKKKSS